MEGILNSQMNKYAEEAGILHLGVHGYRSGMSTVTALVEVQSRLVGAVGEGKLSSLCLLNVNAGFDSISHIYLLRKLELYGYSDKSIDWIRSYLSNRKQIVQVNASKSRSEEVNFDFLKAG